MPKAIVAPKRDLPMHGESFNPPEEYLFDNDEKKKWLKADKEDKVSNEIEELYNKLSGEMGLFMPNIQSAIVTKDFMQAVE